MPTIEVSDMAGARVTPPRLRGGGGGGEGGWGRERDLFNADGAVQPEVVRSSRNAATMPSALPESRRRYATIDWYIGGASFMLPRRSALVSTSRATAERGRSATPRPLSTIFFAASIESSSIKPRSFTPAARKAACVIDRED